jgi:hypothetical protein
MMNGKPSFTRIKKSAIQTTDDKKGIKERGSQKERERGIKSSVEHKYVSMQQFIYKPVAAETVIRRICVVYHVASTTAFRESQLMELGDGVRHELLL